MLWKHKVAISLITAALLIAAAIISPEIGGLLIFVTVFTTFFLWLYGYVQAPRFVRQRRQEATATPPASPLVYQDLAPRAFRMRLNRWAIGFCYIVGIVPLLLGLLTLVAAIDHPVERPTLIVGGLAILAFGVFFTHYAWRVGRLAVRVDANGIEADTLYGSRRIAWGDVVSIVQRNHRMSGSVVTTDHLVYSRDGSIVIAPKIADRDELLQIVLDRSPATSAAEDSE